jgi:hypothetical protein
VVRSAFDAYPAPAFPEWKRRGGDDDDAVRAATQATRSAAGSRASTSHSQRDDDRAARVVFVNDLSQTMTEGAKLHYAKQFMVRMCQPASTAPILLSSLPAKERFSDGVEDQRAEVALWGVRRGRLVSSVLEAVSSVALPQRGSGHGGTLRGQWVGWCVGWCQKGDCFRQCSGYGSLSRNVPEESPVPGYTALAHALKRVVGATGGVARRGACWAGRRA